MLKQIQVFHNGVMLEGYVIVVGNDLVAELSSPNQGQKRVRYGWGAAIMKHPSFLDRDGNISESALVLGQRLLIAIYEEAQPEYIEQQKKIKIKELQRQIEEIENE